MVVLVRGWVGLYHPLQRPGFHVLGVGHAPLGRVQPAGERPGQCVDPVLGVVPDELRVPGEHVERRELVVSLDLQDAGLSPFPRSVLILGGAGLLDLHLNGRDSGRSVVVDVRDVLEGSVAVEQAPDVAERDPCDLALDRLRRHDVAQSVVVRPQQLADGIFDRLAVGQVPHEGG